MKDLHDLNLPSEFFTTIKKISEEIQIECIYLLGAIEKNEKINSIYVSKSIAKANIILYHLLIVKKSEEKKNEDAIQTKIEVLTKNFVPMIAWSMSSQNFIEQIHNNEYFASYIMRKGHLCFGVPLVEKESTPQLPPKSCDATKWVKRAKEFLAGAELFLVRKEFRLAVFMLHQAAEQSYIGHIHAMTGYKAAIHNLHRLHQYTLQLSFEDSAIFPRDNENEERLFQLLKRSYVDSRYATDFYIAQSDLKILFERIKRLSEIALPSIWEIEH
ncbi:MAG TPA: HEPN domain-containing protein [Puia sp.]